MRCGVRLGRYGLCGLVGLLTVMLIASGCSWRGGGEPQHQTLSGTWIIAEDVNDPSARSESNVYYEIFVRAFADSDGDGIGDLRGVVNMLDYLNDGDPETTEDLGVSGIWLMPIHPSPSYHGYDVTDYRSIHPDYGTLEDFQVLIEEAHKRGMKVIMDLVVNHTSSEHPWFLEAAMDPSSPYRDWYVWRDEEDSPIAVSAAGGPAWHRSPGGGADYLGVFWSGMPDLNFDHAAVRREMIDIGKFWLELGVDGFRLDAAKHIYEDLSGDEKNPALQERNLAWWKEFREALQEVNPDVYLVGEVWDSSPARVAPYFQVFDSAFNFTVGELAISAAAREEDSNLAFTLERMHGAYDTASGGGFIDAPFLTNHDQNRVMSNLRGDLNHAKMAASILLTLPGRPFVYYGEEIGMQGVKPDEEIREPMKWADEEGGTSAAGEGVPSLAGIPVSAYAEAMTRWRMPRHQADTPSVLAQQSDPDSLLHHYRALIQLRSRLPVLVSGAIVQIDLEPAQLMAYERRDGADRVLVVHNLGGSEAEAVLKPDAAGTAYERLVAASSSDVEVSSGEEGQLHLKLPPYSTAVVR